MDRQNEKFDIDIFVDDYIEQKLFKNNTIIEISYEDLLKKCKMPEIYLETFFNQAKSDLECNWYSVYPTGTKYIYNNKEKTVSSDLLLIAIKM